MIRTKQGHERVRHSVYWKPETKELLERKSEELNMSQNYLTEICLQIPSRNENFLELNQFCLSPEVKSAIQSLSTQMKCSPEETLEMSLREHFYLPRPLRWIKESWIQGGVIIERE